MRLSLLVFLLLFCNMSMSFAAPGDTTVINTSHLLNADGSVTFDTFMVFPGGVTYRKIFLVYTVNSHACSGSGYCHQWDYIGNVTLLTPTDTLEMARIITPFATSGWTRFPAPPAWSEDYVFDVTDFAPKLQGSVFIRSSLGVGSPGYGIYTKLIFIEGTPDRNVIDIKQLYTHGGGYGNVANPIDNNFPVRSETAPAGTVSSAFRFVVTGHGMDANNCCEFMDHYYNTILNGSTVQTRHIWRNDCGVNELYPQGGTWLYDRSNWCPGSTVIPYYDSLPGITAGTSYNMNVTFEPYTVASPSGNYDATGSVVYYGPLNKTLDASVEDIIAPSSSPQHFRENPSSDQPVVHIHNSGSATIDSVAFTYGVMDSAMQPYTWHGTLMPLTDTIITLPASASLAYMSSASTTGTFQFITAITAVNGTADVDQTNDTMRSQFIVAPHWPDTVVVKMKTSNLGADGVNLNANPADANWYVTNMHGDTVFSRTNTNDTTLYLDTLIMPANGYFKFTVSTPGFCSGLHWWPLDQDANYFPGYLQIKRLSGTNIPLHGYVYAGSTSPAGLKNYGEHDDFGCQYSQYFYISSASTVAIKEIKNTTPVSIYPNPATDNFYVDLGNMDTRGASISVINILGREVYSGSVNTDFIKINSGSFAPGVYMVLYHTDAGSSCLGKIVVVH